MTSQQYEELCRFFIAHEMKLDLAHVVSRRDSQSLPRA